MSKNPMRSANGTRHGASQADKKNVHAGADFAKRSSPLPKPPTTSIANRNPNLKGKRND